MTDRDLEPIMHRGEALAAKLGVKVEKDEPIAFWMMQILEELAKRIQKLEGK